MGDNNGAGPRLFVDGSSHMNAERSDACLAFLVPVIPKPKGEPAKANAKAASSKEEIKVIKPTHTMMHEVFSVVLADKSKCTYKVPYLVDEPANRKLQNQSLYRKRQAFDSEELQKPTKPESVKASFATK